MSRQEIIDEFMDFIDFEKIHKTMEALNWKWAGIEGIPEIYHIRQHLRELLNEFFDRNLYEIRCGGFHIRREEESIIVTFEVDYWEIE